MLVFTPHLQPGAARAGRKVLEREVARRDAGQSLDLISKFITANSKVVSQVLFFCDLNVLLQGSCAAEALWSAHPSGGACKRLPWSPVDWV